jgi:hypothetical protein
MHRTTVLIAIIACMALLSLCASAQEPVTIRMHGVLRSKGSYLLNAPPGRLIGTVYEGHPAEVTHVRDASSDPLLYCAVVDGGQKPEINGQLRKAAADLIRAVARRGDRGRAIVYGKSMKNSVTKDWDSDAAAVATFASTPLDAKGSDPYAPIADCAEHLEKATANGPVIRAIFVVGGRPTEAGMWTTQQMMQRFARADIQLYLVSIDPGLLTGGEQKPTPMAPMPGERRRREWPPRTPSTAELQRLPDGWYAPSLYRIARDSAGDVIQGSPKTLLDVTGLADRLRHQVEFTVLASERDANTYRDFKLKAPDIDVQTATLLYVPKR